MEAAINRIAAPYSTGLEFHTKWHPEIALDGGAKSKPKMARLRWKTC
jgi:hypothetical protein